MDFAFTCSIAIHKKKYQNQKSKIQLTSWFAGNTCIGWQPQSEVRYSFFRFYYNNIRFRWIDIRFILKNEYRITDCGCKPKHMIPANHEVSWLESQRLANRNPPVQCRVDRSKKGKKISIDSTSVERIIPGPF